MSARTWFALALVGLALALWAVIILLERWEQRTLDRDTREAAWQDGYVQVTADEWRDRFLWDDWRDHSPARAEPRRYKPWMDDR